MNLVNDEIVELVFWEFCVFLSPCILKLASKFSSQLFVVPFFEYEGFLALFCFEDLACLVCT